MPPNAASPPETDAAAAKALVREYLDLWNARDVATIWARIYAPGATRLPWDEAGMHAAVAKLESEGFDRTDLLSLTAKTLAPGLAEVRIRFTRRKTDGTIFPPGIRETAYTVHMSGDGWRITEMRSVA